ncbi:MAG: dTDP-4-dehydrorhamnose reductase [Terriglobales bacterium]
MRILLTGKNGQVGWELQRTLSTLGSVHAVDIEDVDLTDTAQVQVLVRGVSPDLIVHPAAYTAVDKAESQEGLATEINAVAPAVLAKEARLLGAAIISYSTDYVFDGSASVPYTEEMPPVPLNAYGRSKLAGDRALAASGAPYLIFRTSWVYAARGANFVRTMLKLGAKREELSIVADQIGAPTSARSLGEATAQIVAILKARSERESVPLANVIQSVAGVYNMTCGGQTTWFGFAEAIFEIFQPMLGRKPKLERISAADYPVAAVRPAYSLLSNEKLRRTFAIEMPEWRDALRLVADELLQ